MTTFKEYYLAYILICMVYHFYTVAMSYRRGGAKRGESSQNTQC